MEIRPYNSTDLDAVVRLSLRAWEPVFASLGEVFSAEVYRESYPQGWRVSQQKAVEAACSDPPMRVWVAVADASVAGFVAIRFHEADKMGEIYMIAVDPDFQRRGLGAALTEHALDAMKSAGMSLAMVETGADDGHAPARRTYEKSGFDLFPVARYFKKL